MGGQEILILVIVIFISVTLLCFFLEQVLKQKKKEKPKEEIKEEVKEEIEEKPKEEPKLVENKPVSIALQNELEEFKDYLKARVTPEMLTEEEKIKRAYEPPRMTNYTQFSDFDSDYPFNRKPQKKTNYESLPDDVKMLLFTDFFDTKF